MLNVEHQRLKILLTEAVTLLCKTGLSYKSVFSVEGLLGITVDNSDVFLVGVKETISKASQDLTIALDSGIKVSDDLLQNLTFTFGGHLVRDDCEKVELDEILIGEAGSLMKQGKLKSSDDEDASLSIPEMAMTSTLDKYAFDEPHSTLFTNVELDEIIEKGNQSKEDGSSLDSCGPDNYTNMLLKQKSMMTGDSDESDGSGRRGMNMMLADQSDAMMVDQSDDILLTSARDDDIGGYSAWDAATDDSLGEIGPLNLAGPQDLSTGISKRKFTCQLCGRHCRSEVRLKKHKCKAATDSTDMAEPLNLKSQPLDLTITRADGEPYIYSTLYLSDGEGITSLTCVCGRQFPDCQSYLTHTATCAKSKLTPYKSCEICGKIFFSNSGYIKHRKLHAGAYKFRCNVCHKGFFDRTHLDAHTDSSHSKVRRYKCQRCDKSFFWKHHLKRHLLTCETDAPATSSSVSEVFDGFQEGDILTKFELKVMEDEKFEMTSEYVKTFESEKTG